MEQNEKETIGVKNEENVESTPQTTQESHEETAKKLKKQRTRQIVASLIGIAILAFGLWKIVCLFLDYSSNETSNDAQIEQYISPVNLRASGYIAKIYFKEHQEVHRGDTLLVLDDREYRIRLMEAEAALKDAKAGANVIDATQLEVEYAATKKKLESVRKQQAAAYKGVNEVSTRKQNVAAAIERAQAAVEMAKLNLSYCVVVAPCDGKLGRRSIEEGQMVNAGTTITYILPNNQKWVIANYKETQVENLYVGQKVRITVDAVSNKEFEGTVTAISGATGSKYSLVPTDNSAGNFVKIQQRVPVRIDFTNISKEDNARLAAGMMVVVKAERK